MKREKVNSAQLELCFDAPRPIQRVTPLIPQSDIDEIIITHGLDACAQAFLRVLQKGDQCVISNKKWEVLSRSKDGESIKVIVNDGKPITITEKWVWMNISGERGRRIMSEPWQAWESRSQGTGRRKYPVINGLLRDIEGELLNYRLTCLPFRRDSAFIDIMRRTLLYPTK